METEEAGWTKENLLKLLASLKARIPTRRAGRCYRKELEAVDWNEVALPPFSPEQCREKWTSIMKKIPKIRTLAELIGEAEDAISDPRHNTKIHPELPKRPAPPAAVFFQENLAQLKNEHPKQKLSELMKISFERFSNVSDEEKAKYERKHRLALKEYKMELKKFSKGYGNPFPVHSTKLKKKKPSPHLQEGGLPPKPVINSYLLFCKEQSKSTGDGQKEAMQKWGKAWQELSETEKKKYVNQGKELKRQYGIKLYNYLKRFDEEEQKKILKENGISRSMIRKSKSCKTMTKLSNEPKMPSPAARTVFISEKMKHMKDIPSSRDRFIEANKMWQNLSFKKKEQYTGKVNEKLRQYSDELQKWFNKLMPEDQRLFMKHNPSKLQYLKSKKTNLHIVEDQPSDSEDEVLEISSSSDEEGNILDLEQEEDKEEEEEDQEESMFEMY